MRIVCISDTHSLQQTFDEKLQIPLGDVLVHAGDFTNSGKKEEVIAFNEFLGRLPHKYKVVIAGNHECTFDKEYYRKHATRHHSKDKKYDPDECRALLTNAIYLEDSSVEIDGFLFYGSPWQPEFCNWAFNLPPGKPLRDKWKKVPSLVDVLITHGPPYGIGDVVEGNRNVGDKELLKEVKRRIRPQVHVFGHIHEGYGKTEEGNTIFVNASTCTVDYAPLNAPIVIDLEIPKRLQNDTSSWRMPNIFSSFFDKKQLKFFSMYYFQKKSKRN